MRACVGVGLDEKREKGEMRREEERRGEARREEKRRGEECTERSGVYRVSTIRNLKIKKIKLNKI